MSKHERIAAHDEASIMGIVKCVAMAVDAAERHPQGRRALGEALCAALDTVAAGAPRYDALGDMRETARWWADCATPAEIEIYLSVILRRLSGLNKGKLAMTARKRIFMEMFNAMPESDQKAFLRKVQKEEK